MRTFWLGWLGLLTALPACGQSVDALKEQLRGKDAQIERLRRRIEVLEREVTPRRIRQTDPPQAPADEPEDSNRALERALVRENGLLLSRGRIEVEPNLVISHSTAGTGFRRDAYGPGLTLRAGLPWRSQFDFGVPYVFERRRSGGVATDSSGIGDLTLGLSHQFLSERTGVPGLIGALGYSEPTGKNTLFDHGVPMALGTGFRAVQASLTAIKRIDPLVFFGSYTFSHAYADTKSGIKVDPGNSHGLRIGTVLATGPDTSLRAAFNLNFYDRTRVDGIALVGSDDPLSELELGSSVVLSESTALDVSIGAGLTRNAPRYRISVALPVRF